MDGSDDDAIATDKLSQARHRPKLREQVWLPKDQKEKFCARCGLVKLNMLTLKLAGERFGLCDRCLETLWNLVWHDEQP